MIIDDQQEISNILSEQELLLQSQRLIQSKHKSTKLNMNEEVFDRSYFRLQKDLKDLLDNSLKVEEYTTEYSDLFDHTRESYYSLHFVIYKHLSESLFSKPLKYSFILIFPYEFPYNYPYILYLDSNFQYFPLLDSAKLVRLDFLNSKNWNPIITISHIIFSLKLLLKDSQGRDAPKCNDESASEFKNRMKASEFGRRISTMGNYIKKNKFPEIVRISSEGFYQKDFLSQQDFKQEVRNPDYFTGVFTLLHKEPRNFINSGFDSCSLDPEDNDQPSSIYVNIEGKWKSYGFGKTKRKYCISKDLSKDCILHKMLKTG